MVLWREIMSFTKEHKSAQKYIQSQHENPPGTFYILVCVAWCEFAKLFSVLFLAFEDAKVRIKAFRTAK